MSKSKLRKKILKVREKFNINNIQLDFNQFIKIFKKEKMHKKTIGGYYPVNFEINDLELLRKFEINKFNLVNFSNLIAKNSKTQVIIINNEIELSAYFKKNLISNEIIIGMGAGIISKWMAGLKSSL